MVAAMHSLDADLEYEVSYRNLPVLRAERELSSQARYHTEARYSRRGRKEGPGSAAHRRSSHWATR